MTKDQVLQLAREAGVSIRGHYDETGSTPLELMRFAQALEAALKPAGPVNTRTKLVQTAPKRIWLGLWTDDEGVAFPDDHEGVEWSENDHANLNVPYIRADLATAPPAQTPLTDDEVNSLASQMVKEGKSVNWLIRQLESAPPAQTPPPWWPAVEAILNEYGLQAIDFVADWKKAQATPPRLTETDMLNLFGGYGGIDTGQMINFRKVEAAVRKQFGATD